MKNHAARPGQFHPSFSRKLIEKAGRAAEEQLAAENQERLGQADPGDPGCTGWELEGHLKEARAKAMDRKAGELRDLTGEELAALIAQEALTVVPQLVQGDGSSTALMGWPLLAAYHTELMAAPAAKGGPVAAANANFLNQVAELHKVQCRACSGYGHTAKYCASLPRVKAAMGSNPVANGWLSRALDRSYPNSRPGVAAPDKLGVLAGLGYKLPEGFLDKDGKPKKSATKR